MRLFFGVSVLAATFSAYAANGQVSGQQTPTNASAFLNVLAGRGNVGGGYYGIFHIWNAHGTDDSSMKTGADWPIAQLVQTEACLTTLIPKTAGTQNYDKIEWAKIATLEVVGDTVEFAYSSANKFRLSFGSKDLAARAGQAMEIIRQSCDATGGTGF